MPDHDPQESNPFAANDHSPSENLTGEATQPEMAGSRAYASATTDPGTNPYSGMHSAPAEGAVPPPPGQPGEYSSFYGNPTSPGPNQMPASSAPVPGPWGPTPGNLPIKNDGISIAALVTGVLGMGVVPLVLGIVGITRTKNGERKGRGMAIAGLVLGALQVVVFAVLFMIGFLAALSEGIDTASTNQGSTSSTSDYNLGQTGAGSDLDNGSSLTSEEIDELEAYLNDLNENGTYGSGPGEDVFDIWIDCALDSVEEACTTIAADQHDLEALGDAAVEAFMVENPAYGDNEALDAIWDTCKAGNMRACDSLAATARLESPAWTFGSTCGERTTEKLEGCVGSEFDTDKA